eukprot:1971081-Pyramimonas_sp.AAC.1
MMLCTRAHFHTWNNDELKKEHERGPNNDALPTMTHPCNVKAKQCTSIHHSGPNATRSKGNAMTCKPLPRHIHAMPVGHNPLNANISQASVNHNNCKIIHRSGNQRNSKTFKLLERVTQISSMR